MEWLIKVVFIIKAVYYSKVVVWGYEQSGFMVKKDETEKMMCKRFLMLYTVSRVAIKSFSTGLNK